MSEVWKAVPGYEGYYEVSDQGRVRSLDRMVISRWGKEYKCYGRVLRPYYSRYYSVELNMKGSRKRIWVHRLVAMAFLPNPDNLPQVNHKDENSKNNKVENLEWCTFEYNRLYGTHLERIAQKRWVPVIGTDKDGNEHRFSSMREAAEKTGVRQGGISDCCRGVGLTAGGYKWRYA